MKVFRFSFLVILSLFCCQLYSGSESSEKATRKRGFFQCDYCYKVFTFDTNRIRHRKAEHEWVRYQCRVCKMLIKDSQAAKNHVSTIHQVPHDKARFQLIRGNLGIDGRLYNIKQCEPRYVAAERRRSGKVDCAEQSSGKRVVKDGIEKLLIAAKFIDLLRELD